ncbi:glycosyltransferase family protein [Pedobacter duraquae]|uniref:Glycosyl transferase family 2 n=1 Tax=Pedobacter duraquae TaxID=425511 RepID=A0A4R6IC28_9SPHI|nr:sugar transferase [Pedobacter duraquae]TDO19028.1 hypothetical protein CLV32_4650 [Pedobacter duraquae]
MSDLAPILLFTYKRLDTLKAAVTALKKNELAAQSDLFIFSDAAKSDHDQPTVQKVREFLKQIDGFNKVSIYESSNNKGLARSIIEGVTKVINDYGRAIVLEDDLLTVPSFLQFTNQALSFYKDQSNVYSISGYNYDFKVRENGVYDNYFVTRGCSWGWATWADRWNKVDWNIANYSDIESAAFKKSFNKSGTDLTSMLLKQRDGLIDSWAIRWYYNQWKLNGLTVYPVRSLIDNQGFDDDATHTKVFNRYKTNLMDSQLTKFNLDPVVAIDNYYQKLMQAKFSIFTRIFWGKGMTILMKLKMVK